MNYIILTALLEVRGMLLIGGGGGWRGAARGTAAGWGGGTATAGSATGVDTGGGTVLSTCGQCVVRNFGFRLSYFLL